MRLATSPWTLYGFLSYAMNVGRGPKHANLRYGLRTHHSYWYVSSWPP